MPKKFHYFLLILLFALAFVLRVWDLPHLPLMHDELSAWSRLQYAHFQNLIELGVKPDGHPAGVQFFLWLWVKIFGDKAWVIKLPFILMGMGSLAFAYQISKKWFSENTALLVLACMASQQFAISLGATVARPYASGLFLSLWMVWAWTHLREKGDNIFSLHFVSYLIASTLCLYNHHFTALFAGIVWLTGVILTRNLRLFGVAALGMGLLYLPHLSIFFHQLQNKGLEWLAKPDVYFFQDYIAYIFHHSLYVGFVVFFIAAFSIVPYFRKNLNGIVPTESANYLKQNRIISLIWFFLPLLIGYAYSVWRAPLLQFSMLIFTYPFLLFFLFSFAQTFKKTALLVALFALISANLYSLVIERQHFDISLHQPHKAFYEYAVKDFPPKDSVQRFYFLRKEYVDYYAKQANRPYEAKYLQQSVKDLIDWREQLEKMRQPYLELGNVPYEFVLLANRYFPYLHHTEKGFTYELYTFCQHKTPNSTTLPVLFSENHTLFANNNIFQQKIPSTATHDDWLVVEVTWDSDTTAMQGEFVLTFKKGDEVVVTRTFSMFLLNPQQKTQTSFFADRILHIFPRHTDLTGTSFTFEAKPQAQFSSKIKLNTVKVSLQQGNEKIYKWVY